MAEITTPGDEWPFKPGQQVRVKPGPGWRGDWQDGCVLNVVGVRINAANDFEVSAVERLPHGITEFSAEDLEPVS